MSCAEEGMLIQRVHWNKKERTLLFSEPEGKGVCSCFHLWQVLIAVMIRTSCHLYNVSTEEMTSGDRKGVGLVRNPIMLRAREFHQIRLLCQGHSLTQWLSFKVGRQWGSCDILASFAAINTGKLMLEDHFLAQTTKLLWLDGYHQFGTPLTAFCSWITASVG